MYTVVEVPPEASELTEALGTKPKFWFTDDKGVRSLYKEGFPRSGEHWAEKVAHEICKLIGIPAAAYDLARWKDRQGVVTPTFVPKGSRLVLGNELLGKYVKDYDLNAQRYLTRQYTVRSALVVIGLVPVAPPLCGLKSDCSTDARDIFVGYLLLDALIGNQDRHHENWGLVVTPIAHGSVFSLAPTFDHASSLGRNETDEERIRRLTTKDRGSSVEHYSFRATSPFYLAASDSRRLSTLAAFHEGALVRPGAASYWLKSLQDVQEELLARVLEQVPESEMSRPAKDFSFEMLKVNRRRLLETSLPR